MGLIASAAAALGITKPPAVVVPSAAAAKLAWWIAVLRSMALLLVVLSDVAPGEKDASNTQKRTVVGCRMQVMVLRFAG